MKCEPEAYTIDDLERDRSTTWEGVRNYQARNLLRDDMQVGDGVVTVKPGAVLFPLGGVGLFFGNAGVMLGFFGVGNLAAGLQVAGVDGGGGALVLLEA